MSPRIVVEHLSGARSGTRRELDADARVSLGRHPRCHVTFDAHADRSVSARHAEIRKEQDGWVFVDLNSANGSYAGGRLVRRVPLPPDEPVELELGRGGPRVRITLATQLEVPETLVGVTSAEVAASRPEPSAPRRRGLLLGAAGIGVVAAVAGFFMVRDARRSRDAEARVAAARTAMEEADRDRRIREELERERAVEPGVRVADENAESLYLIAATTDAGEDQPVCTAFALAPTFLGTNSHCVDAMQAASDRGEKLVAVRNKSGRRVPVKGWVRSSGYRPGKLSLDVGLVELGEPVDHVVRVASPARLAHLGSGQQVFLYGFPAVVADAHAPVASVMDGVIGRVTTLAGEPDAEHGLLVQHNVASSHGASGSPLFDVRGDVIAVNVGQALEAGKVAPGVSVSIRIDGLLPLLEERR